MQRRILAGRLAALGFVAFLASPLGAEGIFTPSRASDVQLKRGLTEAEAKAAIISLREQNRRVIDVEVTAHSPDCVNIKGIENSETCDTILKYDILSEPDSGGRVWDLNIGESADDYAKSWKANSGKGMRLVALEPRSVHTFTRTGPLARKVAFASLWVDDPANIAWVSFSRLSSAEFSAKFKEFAEGKGMVVTSYATYSLLGAGCDKTGPYDTARCIAATFAKPPGDAKSAFMRGLTPEKYTSEREKYEKGGFRTLLLSNGERMATSFVKDASAGDWQSYSRLSAADFDKMEKDMRGKGWRLVDFEAAQMNGEKDANFNGSRIYGGIWHKPGPAPRRTP
jgi:Bacterial tandem repeat domain 1